MVDDEPPIWDEPPHLAGLNELLDVLDGVGRALERPERFSSETLDNLAEAIRAAALRHGVYEPRD